MKQDQANKELPLMNKFEAMVLIRINKEKPLSYAHMIQEAMLSKEKSSSSSEGRRQRFITEYLLSEYPSQKNDVDARRHATLLSQELQELNQRKVLSFIINVEDQSDHNHYILQETVYYMIQEAKLSKEESSSEGRSQRFISEYILSKYLLLKNDDVDRHHTTLLSQKLTQRKVVLSIIINVEDQSANHCILQDSVYCDLLLLLLLLRPAKYPQVVAQQPQGGRDEEDSCDIGIMEKKTRKLKYKSVREIDRRMDDGIEGTRINVDVEVGVFDDDQVTRIGKDSFRRTDMNTVDEPKDDDWKDVVREEEEEGQEQEVVEDDDDEENDEDEGDEEEDVLGKEGEAIGQEEEYEEEEEEEEVGEGQEEEEEEEDKDEEDEDEDEDEDDFKLLESVREAAGLTAEEAAAQHAKYDDEDDQSAEEDLIELLQTIVIEPTEEVLHAAEVNAEAKAAAAKAKQSASKAATEAAKAAREAAKAKIAEAEAKAAREAAGAKLAEAKAAFRELAEAQAAVKAAKKKLRKTRGTITALAKSIK